jgi:hypothetical protein
MINKMVIAIMLMLLYWNNDYAMEENGSTNREKKSFRDSPKSKDSPKPKNGSPFQKRSKMTPDSVAKGEDIALLQAEMMRIKNAKDATEKKEEK